MTQLSTPEATRLPELEAFINAAVECVAIETLLQCLESDPSNFAITIFSYQIVADDLSRVPVDHGLVFENFPDDCIRKHIDEDFEKIDPILEHS